MTCHDMDVVINSHSIRSGMPHNAAEHMAGCDRCRWLVWLLEDSPKAQPPSMGQLDRIHAAILEELTPVRPLASSRTYFFAFVLVFVSVVFVASTLLGVRGLNALHSGQRIAVFAALAASAVLLAFSLVRQMAPGSKRAGSPAAIAMGILAVLLLATPAIFQPQGESAFVLHGLMCLKTGMTYSLPAAFFLWMLLRRGAILYPKLAGAVTGGFTGLIGFSLLEINCPNQNIYHVLIWHWGVLVIGALAGAAFGTAVELLARQRGH